MASVGFDMELFRSILWIKVLPIVSTLTFVKQRRRTSNEALLLPLPPALSRPWTSQGLLGGGREIKFTMTEESNWCDQSLNKISTRSPVKRKMELGEGGVGEKIFRNRLCRKSKGLCRAGAGELMASCPTPFFLLFFFLLLPPPPPPLLLSGQVRGHLWWWKRSRQVLGLLF